MNSVISKNKFVICVAVLTCLMLGLFSSLNTSKASDSIPNANVAKKKSKKQVEYTYTAQLTSIDLATGKVYISKITPSNSAAKKSMVIKNKKGKKIRTLRNPAGVITVGDSTDIYDDEDGVSLDDINASADIVEFVEFSFKAKTDLPLKKVLKLSPTYFYAAYTTGSDGGFDDEDGDFEDPGAGGTDDGSDTGF